MRWIRLAYLAPYLSRTGWVALKNACLSTLTNCMPAAFSFSSDSFVILSHNPRCSSCASRETQLEQRGLWDKMTKESEEKLKAAGMQFVSVDKQAFFKATQPIRDKYGAKYAELIKRIQATK